MMRRLIPATATLALLATAPAHAAVTFTKGRIEVFAPGARAVVTRNPFRGKRALSEVPNGLPRPLLEPPTVDPVPPGTDNASTTTLYAPLSFLVGSESLTQYQGLVRGGNPMNGLRQARCTRHDGCCRPLGLGGACGSSCRPVTQRPAGW